ncbi:MAG: hypothetical protein IKM13_12975 [Clostridia bacterium]|nr:hypothetical protein [Clostridia bacterium]
MKERTSRHPKIQYWSLNEEDILSENYKEVIDRIRQNGCFDTLCISCWKMNLWDLSTKPLIGKVVRYAHDKGIRTPLQVFPKGYHTKWRASVGVEDAVALVTEHECLVEEDCTVIRATGAKNVRYPEHRNSIAGELLGAYAFQKSGDGFYRAGSLIDIRHRAKVLYTDGESLTLSFDTDDLKGCCLYVMVAHYYAAFDLFGDRILREYRELIDAYADLPVNGIVLDELKNMVILPPWQTDAFRERFYGRNFHRYFAEQTGEDLIRILLDMRFCPEGRDEVRIGAINRYFDIFQHSTKRLETFVAEYSREVFGEEAFAGLHNTYHNHLQSDEIWQTGCNWWEVPRKYAQTDEDIPYPIRMGMACGCRENLVYDMYYAPDKEKYFEKAMRDARFGSRIHYHIIRSGGNSSISWDVGSPEFLDGVKPYEDKIELLNRFDPAMPRMELLVVFGFPALCNWYPDRSARNSMDINGKLNIMDRVHVLWEQGYLNALAPSDAVADGRIRAKDGKFDYCGHRFDKLLYLYPQYSKPEVISFLQEALQNGYDLKILGELTRDFDGRPAELTGEPDSFLTEEDDIPGEMALTPNTIPDGCVLEDGSVVIGHYESVAGDNFCTRRFELGETLCEATFKGVFALKLGENGEIEKLVAGGLKEFKLNGKTVLSLDGSRDYFLGEA